MPEALTQSDAYKTLVGKIPQESVDLGTEEGKRAKRFVGSRLNQALLDERRAVAYE